MEYIQFICYAILLLSSLMMVTVSNPINAVLFLISIYFSAALVYTLLCADYLGLILLTVYVGAITVLFLFIVMLVNLRKLDHDRTSYLLLGLVILFLLILQFTIAFCYNAIVYMPSNILYDLNNYSFLHTNFMDESVRVHTVVRLGILIFREFPMYLFIAGLLLLSAMIGAIYLTNFKRGYSARQQYNQLPRNRRIYLVYLH
jgi:NADH-quinone oxidoreductase subunit J